MVIWLNNNELYLVPSFLQIFHKIYAKQVSFQKSETHILLPYWKQSSRDVLQNACSE